MPIEFGIAKRMITSAAVLIALSAALPNAANATSPSLDLDKLSLNVHAYQNYSVARTAVLDAVPLSFVMDDARSRLEEAGMQCSLEKTMPKDLECHDIISEDYGSLEYGSVVWSVDIKLNDNRVAKIKVDVY